MEREKERLLSLLSSSSFSEVFMEEAHISPYVLSVALLLVKFQVKVDARQFPRRASFFSSVQPTVLSLRIKISSV